ncbi:hypothetical protein TrVE_jg7500 [Triparma verrucosa]|uniref:Serine protease n=1 Tax=Triparma verrucosa TaxID=1606542 RepID=A0A9W7FHR4_9STRA|nr:hypothetical protein TrVE_jg7500 [Triparma verrucosa]
MTKTASLLAKLFAYPSQSTALSALQSDTHFKPGDRKTLSKLTAISSSWTNCDQALVENKNDLSKMILDELYAPYKFYKGNLDAHPPRVKFVDKICTKPLKKSKAGFWAATDETSTTSWLPSPTQTFDTVVHFLQSGSGTGVTISCKIVTCAHVVDSEDDDDDDDIVPDRIGRKRVVIYGDGRMFLTECERVIENIDGSQDVARLKIIEEIPGTSTTTLHTPTQPIASATLSETTQPGTRTFCVGNPSSIDLECTQTSRSGKDRSIEFQPPIFHTSVGEYLGRTSKEIHDLRNEISSRGRSPTRGEKNRVIDEDPGENGLMIEHSCWTYWGHSGAPIFDENGGVVGLHSAWCDLNGVRRGVGVELLREVMGDTPKKKATKKRKRGTKQQEVIDLTSP